MNRATVMLLFGGESAEHAVSISSARNVYAAIDDDTFDVINVFIDEHGRWWLIDGFEEEILLDEADQLLPVLGASGFRGMNSGQTVKPDVILPILHGDSGEDGAVQGLSQLLHIPIVGCDVASSAICYDKDLTTHLLAGMGMRMPAHKSVFDYEARPNFTNLAGSLGEEMFVKPVKSGSSIGVSRVTNDAELASALDEAFRYDNHVLIQKAIHGRELEVGVLGSQPFVEASEVGEITSEDFYDYETKYGIGSTAKLTIPAAITAEVRDEVRMQALKVFEILNCRGLARVDFFLTHDDEIFVNEVNTMPGFTNASMYPKLWAAAGVTYPELIERLIRLALDTNQ